MGVLNGEVKMLLTTSSDTQDAAVPGRQAQAAGRVDGQAVTADARQLTIGGRFAAGFEVNVRFGIRHPPAHRRW